MALGVIVNPKHSFLCKLELPCSHTSSLGSLISRRPVLQHVCFSSTHHSPAHPRLPSASVLASEQQGVVNAEPKETATYEFSSMFLEILKQRNASGLSNDLEDKDGNQAGFPQRRRSNHMENATNHEISSSSTDGDDHQWFAGDEDFRDRREEHRLALSKSSPSIPAKFSKYTRWKGRNQGNSRSVLVKQQLKERNLQNQGYFKEKAVFFQDFVAPVIIPEQVCQFSYSEHPSVAPIGFREPVYSPFGPENMVRPWTGKRPYQPRKGYHPEFDSFKIPPAAMNKAWFVQPPGPFLEGTGPKLGRTREQILGEPLSRDEVRELVAEACSERRRVDIGKDGLTHNMLDLLHRHWKRRRVCRIKCYGVPTVDMNNLCRVIEDKSGGKIIRRSQSILYVFRGRNYNWATRPKIPIMLWKPPAPIYPPVVQRVPEGLSVEEADKLHALGRRIHCLCRLKSAGMYQNLVKTVKDAFEVDEVVKVDCRELDRSDMKKIGAKLRDLVPCVPLSFDRHFMLLWKGSKLHGESQKRTEGNVLQEQLCADVSETADVTSTKDVPSDHEGQINCNTNTRESADIDIALKEAKGSLDMNATAVTGSAPVSDFDRLWQEAIDSDEVVILDETEAGLDSVLVKVESQNSGSQSWDYALNSWEEKPSEPDNESSEMDEDKSTLGAWEVDEDQEDQEDQLEEVSNAEELLPSSLTDITIPHDELERLCAQKMKIKGWMRIGTKGITRGVVKEIHSRWLVSEIAKVRFIAPGCNMKEVHEDLERLTGGIVIWREGPAVVIYRGKDYVPGWMRKLEEREEAYRKRLQSLGLEEEDERKSGEWKTHTTKITETEIKELLDDLGPEYTEWTEGGSAPVDGDLLVPPVSGFKRPFRHLPYGVRPRLSNIEMTEMRDLAKELPPHFALGKRRGLEGLATAIVKLWEKSEIAKVVLKRGISRIDNDRMAAELLRLTGGDLIAGNMSFIALFRGYGFLPAEVKSTLEEKNRTAMSLLEDEERTRLAGFHNATGVLDAPLKPSNAGTLAESLEEKARWDHWQNSRDYSDQMILGRKATRDQALQRMRKLISAASQKIARAERELKIINLKMRPKDTLVRKEQVSDEEKFTLRKIGLRMKPFLLLGRREVFGGTIENMHLNWKWRELVKIIVKKSYFMYRDKDEVEQIARMLEAESGGVLVGICPIPVGVAIIVYRGKDYQRPIDGINRQGQPNGLRPPGLLSKRKAWERFDQKRRKLALERHLRKLEWDFNMLQADLRKMEEQNVNLDNEGGKSESLTTPP